MVVMAFLADITSHLNDINLKLQGMNNSVCFGGSCPVFLEEVGFKKDCTHFPALKKINERDASSHVEFIQKLIVNFRDRFETFSIGDHLFLFIRNLFLVKNVITFSQEAKQLYKT